MDIVNISMAVIINDNQTRDVKLFNVNFHTGSYHQEMVILGDTFVQPITQHLCPLSSARVPRTRVTMFQYACYRLARNYSYILFWPFPPFITIQQNQANLPSQIYNNLTNLLELRSNSSSNNNISQQVILPLISHFNTINNNCNLLLKSLYDYYY